jgi:hypothetical protein
LATVILRLTQNKVRGRGMGIPNDKKCSSRRLRRTAINSFIVRRIELYQLVGIAL